jgi:CMP-N-acetylneuraminic acid synthetase
VSGDLSSDSDVILDFFEQHPEFRDSATLLSLCTYPFMKSTVLEQMVQVYQKTDCAVFAVVESHYMPQKLLRVENGVIRPYLFEQMDEFEANTKVLLERYPRAYHSTGAFLIADAFRMISSGKDLWHQEHIGYVPDDSFHVDIDTLEDFELAQLRYEQTKRYE